MASGTGIYTGAAAGGTGAAATKTLSHVLIDDLAVFFDPTNGFAVTAIYTPAGGSATPINVIFDDSYSGANPGVAIQIETTAPQALAKTSDVASVTAGDRLSIGGVNYYIIDKQLNPPEGGPKTTMLILSTEWNG